MSMASPALDELRERNRKRSEDLARIRQGVAEIRARIEANRLLGASTRRHLDAMRANLERRATKGARP
jgi:hypothetical protein